jgi:hypothetical protein
MANRSYWDAALAAIQIKKAALAARGWDYPFSVRLVKAGSDAASVNNYGLLRL